jgi:hypothetical protein
MTSAYNESDKMTISAHPRNLHTPRIPLFCAGKAGAAMAGGIKPMACSPEAVSVTIWSLIREIERKNAGDSLTEQALHKGAAKALSVKPRTRA